MNLVIPYGTTEPQDVQLRNNGEAFDGSGLDIELVIDNRRGTVGSPAPVAEWLDQAAGTVRVTGVGVLAVGLYDVRYRVTTGSDVGFFPNGDEPDVWEVVAVP